MCDLCTASTVSISATISFASVIPTGLPNMSIIGVAVGRRGLENMHRTEVAAFLELGLLESILVWYPQYAGCSVSVTSNKVCRLVLLSQINVAYE